MQAGVSRRAVLAGGAAALLSRAATNDKLKISVFSKHLQFLQGEDLAKAAAEIGFDGIDITLRKGGHIEPDRVRQDLPPLAGMIRKHGLEVPMVTTDIVDPDTPHAEDIVKTLADLGIRYYRFMPSGGFRYTANQPYTSQLEAFRPRVARLAELNRRYQVCAMYHTHSGRGLVGASIWDLPIIMKDVDPKWVGVNYDVAHATIEGGLGGWINSFRISEPHLRGIAVKDFSWGKDARNAWQVQWQPIGQGMVHLEEFFGMLAGVKFAGPVQVHFEYPLGGANNGGRSITIPKEEVYAALKRDLVKIRGYVGKAGL
jgi:sugar phosphate isomerase/epimerase